MSKLKVSELFYSLQGEGRYVGVPSVFLRTFGCNFKCSGFGCAPGVVSTEADEIAKNAALYTNFTDLPLANTGCDSYASWHPAFKHLSPTYDINTVVSKMLDLTPNHCWAQNNGNHVHLVITGGEPLLGWQRAYRELLEHSAMQDLKYLTFETNGTQELHADFKHYLTEWVAKETGREVTFSVSPKLSASGETAEDAIKPSVVSSYQLYGQTYLKFVVETEKHVNEAVTVVNQYRKAGFTGAVYLMPQGGIVEPYDKNKLRIANICVERGWNYSPRLHVDLWGNGWAK